MLSVLKPLQQCVTTQVYRDYPPTALNMPHKQTKKRGGGWNFADVTLRLHVGLDRQLSFIKLHLGAAVPEAADTEALHVELAHLRQKCDLLVAENKELRNRVRRWSKVMI